jgi:hypothetical protein
MLPSAVFGKRKQRDAQQDAWQMQAQPFEESSLAGTCNACLRHMLCTQDMLQLLLLLFT